MPTILLTLYAQGSWHGGGGVCAPVPTWGTRFCYQNNMAWGMPGQINPLATGYNWSSWQLDTIELTTPGRYGNAFPADMDGDGDVDVVAYRNYTTLTVYLNDGLGNFTPHVVENTSSFTAYTWPVWVRDVDQNGRPDILAPMRSGLYVYYQIAPLTFVRQQIVSASSPYWCGVYISYADAGDVDHDGDVDIVATNGCGPGSGGGGGDIVLFRNDGGTWTPILLYNSHPTDNNYKAMRIYLTDLNNDGWLDIVTSYWPVIVLKNSAGSFPLSNIFNGVAHNTDGLWPQDVDADGDVDLIYAPYQGGSFRIGYLRNDGGFSFTQVIISSSTTILDFYDGLYAGDFNSDGSTDFLGALTEIDIYVGPTFTKYDNVDGGPAGGWNIHNLYFADVERYGCADIQQDIVFTQLNCGGLAYCNMPLGHYILKNRTVTSYASDARLISSPLEAPLGTCSFKRIYYSGCSPPNWTVRFFVRWGSTPSDLSTSPWVGPVPSGQDLTLLGLNPTYDRYLQYRVDFVRTGPPANNAPALDSVWVTQDCNILVGDRSLLSHEKGRISSGTAVYYTVDGKRLNSPPKRGVFFVIRDGKVEKRLIR